MLWFEPFPWARWALVLLVAAAAAYVELKPDASVESPFAIETIHPGDTIDADNTELRRVPAGLLETAERGTVATRRIAAGSPVLQSSVGELGRVVPPGWWIVAVALPDGAEVGDDVRLVIVDTGEQVPGVVAHGGSDDPFGAADAGVAVPPDRSAEVAMASFNGRLAVLVSAG